MTDNSFSRKDFTSLISADVFSSTRPVSNNTTNKNKEKENQTKNKKDQQQQSRSKRQYRPKTNKLLQHHVLAMMEEEEDGNVSEEEEEEEDDGFVRPSGTTKRQQRVKSEPVIIQKILNVKKRRYDDDDDDDDISVHNDPNSNVPSSSSSVPRRNKEAAVLIQSSHQNKKQIVQNDESSSTNKEEDDASSSDDDSSSDSSSSEEEMIIKDKPLFIPKSKREKIISAAQQEEKQQLDQEEQVKRIKQRTLESRALVAEVISLEQSSTSIKNQELQNVQEEHGGATNARPDDDIDEADDEKEREKWTIRELLRILQLYDDEHIKQKLQEEYLKRKAMTDEEIMLLQREQLSNTTSLRENTTRTNGIYQQRYYHRGAYYMDEDTLQQSGPDDIRHKAKLYEQAATGNDLLVDTRVLPKIKQVKHFGLSGYSTKYKGLAKEDTTDTALNFIPHVSSTIANKK